jgi:hypothetical protein
MGMRGRFSGPSFRQRPPPKRPVTHMFSCRECGRRFRAKRDDARFCGARCKQANYRRRGALTAKIPEKIMRSEA